MRISDWSSDVCSSDLRSKKSFHWMVAITARLAMARATYSVSSNADAQASGVSTIWNGGSISGNRRLNAVTRSSRQTMRSIVGKAQISAMLSGRSEEHTYEFQSLMRISYAVF